MGWQLYLALSTMMALEFAVRGSWGPVLSARLLGPLGMSGRQVGWIYAMYPLTCIAAPLIAGLMLDRCRANGRHQWRAIFIMPCITLALCALAFVIYFTEQT